MEQHHDDDPMSEALSLNAMETDLNELNLEDLITLFEKSENDPNLQPELVIELIAVIGDRYESENNKQKEFEWRLKGAEKGCPEFQSIVGRMYDEGNGVEENVEKAFYWLKKAAEGEELDSQILLGWFYESGRGVEENQEMALYWYKKAADNGSVDAIYRCGNVYYMGDDYSVGFGKEMH